MSVEDWFRALGLWEEEGLPQLISQITTTVVGQEPDDLGVHYLFDYIKSGFGLDSLNSDFKDGAQALLIKEG